MRRPGVSIVELGALIAGVAVALSACSRGPAIPDQPLDDPSTRTTTLSNPPSSPMELAKECDVPMYPGAKAPDGMSRLPRKNQDGSMTYDLVLTTNDSPEKVANFYAEGLKLKATKAGGAVHLMGKTPKKNDVILTIESGAGQTIVRISSIKYSGPG
jgi:hypothetical protein